MKRILLYSLLFLSGLLGLTACFEDKSTEADHFIPEIEIDTVGIAPILEIKQFEVLKVSPSVSREGLSSSDFSYKWMLSMDVLQTDISTDVDYMCVGTEKDLETEIILPSHSYYYRLWYQVTDNTTGIRKDIIWKLKVQAPYNEGLLVAETSDGKTTDFGFIEDQIFTLSYEEDKAAKTYHGIYSTANGAPIDGLVKQLCTYKRSQKDYAKYFYAIGDDFMMLMDKDYILQGQNMELTYDRDISIAPMQVINALDGYFYYVLVNDGLIWPVQYDWVTKQNLSVALPMDFVVEEDGLPVSKECRVDKCMAYTHSQSNMWAVWYDPEHGMFFYVDKGPFNSTGLKTFATEDSWPFDPNNCPNLETVYGAVGGNNDLYMIMRNKETQRYQIYVFAQKGCVASALYDIPSNEMDNAIDFVVSENANVVYFATEHDLYAIPLSAETVEVTKIHSYSEEITHFSMFRQAAYIQNPGNTSGLLETHEYTLLVGLWNGTGGTLQAIPIVSPMIGGIDLNDIESYTGFGKILTVVHQKE